MNYPTIAPGRGTAVRGELRRARRFPALQAIMSHDAERNFTKSEA
jgi:hypothetical protein